MSLYQHHGLALTDLWPPNGQGATRIWDGSMAMKNIQSKHHLAIDDKLSLVGTISIIIVSIAKTCF